MEPSGTCCHAGPSFRPRGFSPPRRVAPPEVRGLVASRCRPWGSSGFRLGAWLALPASPPMLRPPELFSAHKAGPASPQASFPLGVTTCVPVWPGVAVFRALLRVSVRDTPPPLPAALVRCSPGLPVSGASCPPFVPIPRRPRSTRWSLGWLLVGLRLPPERGFFPPTGSRPRRWSSGASARCSRWLVRSDREVDRAALRGARFSPLRGPEGSNFTQTLRRRSSRGPHAAGVPPARGRHDSFFYCYAVHRAPVASPRGAMRRSVRDTATSASEGLRAMPASCLPAAAESDPGANPGSSSLPPDGQARPGSVRPASADRAVPSFQTLCGAGVAACLAFCSPSSGVPPTTPLRPFAPSGRDRRPSRRAAAAGHQGAYRMSSPTFSRLQRSRW